MKISVAICTWNRSRLLKQTLEHLARMRLPEGIDWELIIVDNRSEDDTREVIQQFEGQLPIVYVFEPVQGHSRSRNAAIGRASGDLMVWTDNDVIVDPGWLASHLAGAEKHLSADFFGGRIEPVFELERPEWLTATWDKCQPVYATRDLGDSEFRLAEGQFPYGANFAIRTAVQRQFLFDESAGRQADGMLGEDEVGVLRRVEAAGHHGVWLPEASLQHFIPADRATPEYVGSYFFGQGRANVLKGRPTMDSRWHAFRVAVHNYICFRIKRRKAVADEWVSHLIRANIAWGEFRQWNG